MKKRKKIQVANERRGEKDKEPTAETVAVQTQQQQQQQLQQQQQQQPTPAPPPTEVQVPITSEEMAAQRREGSYSDLELRLLDQNLNVLTDNDLGFFFRRSFSSVDVKTELLSMMTAETAEKGTNTEVRNESEEVVVDCCDGCRYQCPKCNNNNSSNSSTFRTLSGVTSHVMREHGGDLATLLCLKKSRF